MPRYRRGAEMTEMENIKWNSRLRIEIIFHSSQKNINFSSSRIGSKNISSLIRKEKKTFKSILFLSLMHSA